VDTDTFMQWARAASVWHPKVVVHQCPETGLRGLRAIADVADGEVFLKVPLTLCVRDDGDGGPLLDAWQTRLALRLMNAAYGPMVVVVVVAVRLAFINRNAKRV